MDSKNKNTEKNENCPTCEKELKGLFEYPIAQINEFRRLHLLPTANLDLKSDRIYVDPSIENSKGQVPQEVYDLFDKTHPGTRRVNHDGWTWTREARCDGDWYLVADNKKEATKTRINKHNEDHVKLAKLVYATKTDFWIHLDDFGNLYYRPEQGCCAALGLRKTLNVYYTNSFIQNSIKLAKDIGGHVRLRIEHDPAHFVYQKHTRDGRKVSEELINPFLEKLESLVGKEIETTALKLPSLESDGLNTDKYTLSISEAYQGNNKFVSIVQLNKQASWCVPLVLAEAAVGILKYEGKLEKTPKPKPKRKKKTIKKQPRKKKIKVTQAELTEKCDEFLLKKGEVVNKVLNKKGRRLKRSP